MKALRTVVLAVLTLALPAASFAEEAAAPSVKVTPYGFVQLSSYFDANTFAAKDYPGQASKAQAGGAFLMSARYSRLGFKLAVDDSTNWTGATVGGGMEFDFKAGHLATTSTTWYNGVMRLRLAYLTADWKTDVGTIQVLAGQHYGIVTGLFATSLTWTADPLFWLAGNAWRRAPQVRVSYLGSKDMLGLNLAVAMLSPQTADGASADYGSGNRSRTPSLEGRVGIDAKFDPITVTAGVGYETGKRRLDDPTNTAKPKDVTGSIMGVDALIGSQWVDVKGEYFNQEGAGDTYNTIAPGAGAATGKAPVAGKSTGYWAQVVLKPIPQVTLHAGLGKETVNSSTVTDLAMAASARKENQQVAAGIIFNAGKFWKFGAEVCKTTSTYVDGVKQDAMQTAVSTSLFF